MPVAYALLPVVNDDRSIIVDAPLHPTLSRYRWYMPKTQYAGAPRPYTIVRNGGKYRQLRLARIIMKASDGLYPKHLNGNVLDCRRGNIELISRKDDAGS